MWKKDPEKIKIIDCRTPEEYVFVGHAPMALNMPGNCFSFKWDAEKKDFVLPESPNCVTLVKKRVKPTDILLVMCRSGHRSAKCIERLAKAGFTKVYNIHDGFEGDKVQDKNDPDYGKRTKNGWRNFGLPWTYDLAANLIYLPVGKVQGGR